ncbi:hypothetical protein GCM10007285_13690 [Stappia taiwanensis]|nr:hypothetical protein GCM10007285_13690 [Stappia taiwanensis]
MDCKPPGGEGTSRTLRLRGIRETSRKRLCRRVRNVAFYPASFGAPSRVRCGAATQATARITPDTAAIMPAALTA